MVGTLFLLSGAEVLALRERPISKRTYQHKSSMPWEPVEAKI